MPIREQALPNNAPLGPALLAARLREYGATDVNILDLNAYRIDDAQARTRGLSNGRVLSEVEVFSLIEAFLQKHGDQDLIGLSGLITTLAWQKRVARIVRAHRQNGLLVSGGGLATEFRENLFPWIPELDGIAHSEGDDVILKIAFDAKLIKNQGLTGAINSGLLNPYCRGIKNHRPLFVYDGGRPNSLDQLPLPAWDLLHTDIYGNQVLENYIVNPIWGNSAQNSSSTPFKMQRSLNTVSSRGCPFACRFCFRGAQGERNYGVRSSQNLLFEVEYLSKKYNIDFIGFTDDNFMVDRRRIQEMASQTPQLPDFAKIPWGTHGRLDEAADQTRSCSKTADETVHHRRVDYMAEAGCTYIGFGI